LAGEGGGCSWWIVGVDLGDWGDAERASAKKSRVKCCVRRSGVGVGVGWGRVPSRDSQVRSWRFSKRVNAAARSLAQGQLAWRRR
jgi:hypothetical protein